MTLFKLNRVCEFCSDCANFVRIVRIWFQLCELCEFVRILYTVRIFFGLCELCVNCVNCAKNCSNFRTQKEHNKEQGPVRFFCANFLFILKELNRTTMSMFGMQCARWLKEIKRYYF